jgi:hypothetical protein
MENASNLQLTRNRARHDKHAAATTPAIAQA